MDLHECTQIAGLQGHAATQDDSLRMIMETHQNRMIHEMIGCTGPLYKFSLIAFKLDWKFLTSTFHC